MKVSGVSFANIGKVIGVKKSAINKVASVA
jgi:hypothetical protein